MAVKTIDIALSEFEQGGFYIDSGGNYSSSTEVRTSSSSKIVIPDMYSGGNIINLTIISEGNKWSFGGYNSSNSFVDMRPEASGYKESGTIINISSYTQTRTLRIELHNDNGISPPQQAILRVVYEDGVTWEMEGDYPVPTKSFPLLDSSFTKPYPASLWRIDENNDGLPYNELMPDILYYEPAQTLGAFEDAASLASVHIPITVKTIGATAFKGTALQRVKIAADCTYYETSFPEGCVITRYTDDRYEQLRDGQGRAILDCDARRIFVRKAENTNG